MKVASRKVSRLAVGLPRSPLSGKTIGLICTLLRVRTLERYEERGESIGFDAFSSDFGRSGIGRSSTTGAVDALGAAPE